MPIPKIIYQTYFTRDLPLVTQFFIWRMKKMNPGYKYEFYDDERIESFLKNEMPEENFQAYKRITIGAAKADFFRYNILYRYGGVYLDIDSTIKGDLDKFIRDDDSAIISKERNPGMYVQWALIFEAGHPFLKRTIEKILDNIEQNRFPNDVHQMTGPSVYSSAIRECLEQGQVKFREVGVDYDDMFQFKHPLNKLLYGKREHWKKTQLKQPVIDSK